MCTINMDSSTIVSVKVTLRQSKLDKEPFIQTNQPNVIGPSINSVVTEVEIAINTAPKKVSLKITNVIVRLNVIFYVKLSVSFHTMQKQRRNGSLRFR